MANQLLNDKNDELQNANEEINQQTEEIITQRDLLENQHNRSVKQNKGIIDSIRYAYRIQEAIFPEKSFLDSILPEYFIFNRPRDIVSGDFYWVQHYHNKTFVIVADSTGHGVPGAFMSMLGTSLLNEIIRMYISMGKVGYITAAQILDELRDKVKKSLHQNGKANEAKDGMDMSLCIIDSETNELQFAGANNPILIIQNDNPTEVIQLKPDRMPVSIHKREKPFSNQHFSLKKGDTIYMQSDGITDQFGGETGQKLFMKRYKTKIIELNKLPLVEQRNELENYFVHWMGKYEQIDDVLVMAIRY